MSGRDLTTGQTAPTADEKGLGDRRLEVPHLVVVLDGDDPRAGSDAAAIHRKDIVVIGRGARRAFREMPTPANALRLDLPDRRTSSEHATIRRDGDRFSLTDVGSTNGTWVNGTRVEHAALTPGDVIRIGHTCLLFDEQIAVRPARSTSPAWAFRTLSGGLASELSRLERIASTPIPILLLGESGTGKEILARAIHARSGRRGDCIGVNCGALPEALVEAHLFGHQRGAFSGAVRDEVGFVRAADQGSLLLDEIADLPLSSQVALLRVLQEGEVTPVGGSRPVKVGVRFLAATHRPIERMVTEGRFRADLFARISGFIFTVPPLRERICDLGLLVASLLDTMRAGPVRIRPDVIEAWLEYSWPLNVRELEQCLSTSIALAEDGTIRLADLPAAIARSQARAPRSPVAPLTPEEQALRDQIAEALGRSGGNVSAVARELGKARQQVQRWVRRFGLSHITSAKINVTAKR